VVYIIRVGICYCPSELKNAVTSGNSTECAGHPSKAILSKCGAN
jgi:predicted nucleic acid-binding Zn finger protein